MCAGTEKITFSHYLFRLLHFSESFSRMPFTLCLILSQYVLISFPIFSQKVVRLFHAFCVGTNFIRNFCVNFSKWFAIFQHNYNNCEFPIYLSRFVINVCLAFRSFYCSLSHPLHHWNIYYTLPYCSHSRSFQQQQTKNSFGVTHFDCNKNTAMQLIRPFLSNSLSPPPLLSLLRRLPFLHLSS